jgi:hypothetical protein
MIVKFVLIMYKQDDQKRAILRFFVQNSFKIFLNFFQHDPMGVSYARNRKRLSVPEFVKKTFFCNFWVDSESGKRFQDFSIPRI